MQTIIDQIKKNIYVREVSMSIASEKLQEAFKEHNIWNDQIRFFHAMIQYPPKWHKESDIFTFLRKKMLKKLRNDRNIFYLLDASTEGFSTIYGSTPFFDILYFNCIKHNISPKKIIFVSSNMVEERNIIRYNMENNIKESIHVACFNNFEQMLFNLKDYTRVDPELVKQKDLLDKFTEDRYRTVVKESTRFYYGRKYFLSLSRVNRPHRMLSTYEIFNSDIFSRGMVSHNKLLEREKVNQMHEALPINCGITEVELEKFIRILPLIVDTEDFKTNHAMSFSSHLHWATLFQVVNETFAENWLNTSRFWSEKTFRAIYHMQPFIIWGQPGANKNLQDYGYKLYDKMFDYHFDSIKDTTKRWRVLMRVLTDTVKYLDSLNTNKQLEWRFQCQDILKHNYSVMYREEHTKRAMKDLAFKIKAVVDGTDPWNGIKFIK
tara:strand:+ start:2856 stop:4160 length:1305 start_codon:yes stop_codon:yes gene_type:complete